MYNNVKISIKDYSPNIIIFNFSSYFEKQYFFKLIKIIYSKKIKFIGIDTLFKFNKYMSHIWIPHITISKKQIGKNIYFGWDKIIVEKIKKNNVLGKHILFLIGGTDKYKLSEKIPNLLNNKIQSENKFLWVQGPFAKPPKIKKKYKKNWKIYKNPQNIYNLIFKAKCCFVLFGTTFFEVVNAGIPQVTYIPKGKEKQILVKKLKKNFLIENNLKVSLNKINLILKNYDKFKQKAKKNKKLIIFKKRKKFLNYILNFNE